MNPISPLVSTLDVDIRSERDLKCLESIGNTCRSLSVPIVAGVTREAIQVERLAHGGKIKYYFERNEFAQWRLFRKRDCSSFVFLTLTRFSIGCDGDLSESDATGSPISRRSWCSSPVLLAISLLSVFSENGWTARAGYPAAPLPAIDLEDICRRSFPESKGCFLETPLYSDQIQELSTIGVTVPSLCKGSNIVRFFYVVAASEHPSAHLRLGERILVCQLGHFLRRTLLRDASHLDSAIRTKHLVEEVLQQLTLQPGADSYRPRPLTSFTVDITRHEMPFELSIVIEPNMVSRLARLPLDLSVDPVEQ